MRLQERESKVEKLKLSTAILRGIKPALKKARNIFELWDSGDGDMGELAIGLYDLTAHYELLLIDSAQLEQQVERLEEALKDSEGALHAARAAFTLVQGEYYLKIMNALTRNDTLQPVHFVTWADSIRERNGYSGANIKVWLRELAEALAQQEEA